MMKWFHIILLYNWFFLPSKNFEFQNTWLTSDWCSSTLTGNRGSLSVNWQNLTLSAVGTFGFQTSILETLLVKNNNSNIMLNPLTYTCTAACVAFRSTKLPDYKKTIVLSTSQQHSKQTGTCSIPCNSFDLLSTNLQMSFSVTVS